MALWRYNLYIINSIHFKVLNDLNYFSDFQQIDEFVQPSLPSSFFIFPSPIKLLHAWFWSIQFPCRAPGNRQAALCLHRFACSGHFEKWSRMTCTFMSGFFESVWRFWHSPVLQRVSILFPFTAERCSTVWMGHTLYTLLECTLGITSWRSSRPSASWPPCLLSPWNMASPGNQGQSGLPGFGPWGCNLGTLHSLSPSSHRWLQTPVPGLGSEPSYITWTSYDRYIQLIGLRILISESIEDFEMSCEEQKWDRGGICGNYELSLGVLCLSLP